jgi:Bacterial alpha-L-rhamnosidase 6 hairpin glycosidase domain
MKRPVISYNRRPMLHRTSLVAIGALLFAGTVKSQVPSPWLPDSGLAKTYEKAAVGNVLAAVNPKVFFGYWSVCADGQGFGYGNTYPSLDGHQLTDALLWLGQVEVVEANWNYVRSFQRQDGLLPLAILPSMAGKLIGPDSMQSRVDPNGGLYTHWVPGNPLEATASITYIQNADVIFRNTLDIQWLEKQLPSINLAADYLDSLTTDKGAVRGGGYYVERPTRIESDGVTQCYAVDALRRVAALNRIVLSEEKAKQFDRLADRIQRHFDTVFWVKDHFAEYLHPQRGRVASHGLTDVDWAAIATGVATNDQQAVLWPKLKDENRFHYGGMPTGIATRPETYEAWEFTTHDRYDLAAMGRVWYLEAWARWRMKDAEGLLDGLQKVSQVGRENGYSWRERYQPDGEGGVRATGPDTYCEYPANLIRIVQRFLLGVDFRLDGSVVMAPVATGEFWHKGFGQTLAWRGRSLRYRMTLDRVEGTYSGTSTQRIGVRLPPRPGSTGIRAGIDGRPVPAEQEDELTFITLPATRAEESCRFEIVQ